VGVNDALVRMIILVGEQNRPIMIKRCRIHSKSMILSGNKATTGVRMGTGLVKTSITIPWYTNITMH